MLESSSTSYLQARAAWRAAKAAAAHEPEASLPPTPRVDLNAMHGAGPAFTVTTHTPTPSPPPARELTAAEVGNLDAADPMRTLYSYQKSFAVFNRPVPYEIVQNLHMAFRDMTARAMIGEK